MSVDKGDGGLHHKYPFHNQRTMNSENIRILVTDFRWKSYKGGGSVIPLLEDTWKEWGFLQVMTQVIGQESYQATLHPLPIGSRIMGGQGKEYSVIKGVTL
jgi:hypothetical protein